MLLKIAGVIILLGAVILPTILASFMTSSAFRTCLSVTIMIPVAYIVYQILTPDRNKKIPSDRKAVLITGCDSGFGLLSAKWLAQEGFQIFALCLNEKSDGAKELSLIDNIYVLKCDVTKDEDVENAKKFVDENLNDTKLWAIVNNAGVGFPAALEWTPLEIYKFTMEVNCFGIVRICQAFLPLIRKSKGRVINVASIAGYLAGLAFSSYGMSKHAAVALTDSLRREMDHFGVTVHTIAPAFFKTPLVAREKVLNDLKRCWEKAPENVKEDYGTDYFKMTEKMAIYFAEKDACPNIQLVIEAISHAVSSVKPKIIYRPSRHPFWLYPLVCSFPYHIQDRLIRRIIRK